MASIFGGGAYGDIGEPSPTGRALSGSVTVGNPDMFAGFQMQQQRALQEKLGLAPIQWAKEKFNAILPMLTGALGASGGLGGVPVPNATTPINTSPIWNPQQIQGRVNQMRGTN